MWAIVSWIPDLGELGLLHLSAAGLPCVAWRTSYSFSAPAALWGRPRTWAQFIITSNESTENMASAIPGKCCSIFLPRGKSAFFGHQLKASWRHRVADLLGITPLFTFGGWSPGTWEDSFLLLKDDVFLGVFCV